jgi:hypothetical protein
MTSINLPKDDTAVREARIQNKNTPSVQGVKQISQTHQVESVNPQREAPQPRTALRQRAKKDRRQGDRRKRQIPVLLDTRSHQERRKKLRRGSDLPATDEESTTANRRGIDVYT